MATVQVASHPAVFTTKTPHVLPAQKYMIPATWRRYQLSQLINKVLSLPQPVPFDFLIRGEVVGASIGEWCAEHGEETLEIEYIESLMPPQRMTTIMQDDWVSSVSCQVPGAILAGSYDANVRIFDASQTPVHTIAGHSAPVTSVCWVGTGVIASASHDRSVRLVRIPEAHDGEPNVLASLHLHTAPVSSVASDRNGTRLLTSSWDTFIGVWTTTIPDSDEVPAENIGEERKKRRKVVEEARPVRKAPEHVMKSHTGRVTRALFSVAPSSEHQAYSCGLDSTFRMWDTTVGVCTSTITLSEKPLTDLALLADGATALASSTDRTVSLFDLRNTTTSATTLTLAHSSLPSTLSAHATDIWRVMSGAYDGVVRVWDVRSAKAPVASFKNEKGGKVLSVDWGTGICAMGGEDGVEVWKIGESGEKVQ
ncbi:WD40 repeat-like protein [Ramaria rubella]|nr:WD40 repeat-like protein [Ramaria rubella]